MARVRAGERRKCRQLNLPWRRGAIALPAQLTPRPRKSDRKTRSTSVFGRGLHPTTSMAASPSRRTGLRRHSIRSHIWHVIRRRHRCQRETAEPAGRRNVICGGIHPKLGNVQFDFGMTSYFYPNETPPVGVAEGIIYWEAMARADTTLGGVLQVAGGFAWSPNSPTPARGQCAAFGMGFDLPARCCPRKSAHRSPGVWATPGSAIVGGAGRLSITAYVNWNAGITFTHKISISTCATPTPTCRRKISSSSPAIRVRRPPAKSMR